MGRDKLRSAAVMAAIIVLVLDQTEVHSEFIEIPAGLRLLNDIRRYAIQLGTICAYPQASVMFMKNFIDI